jgi:hypothetical protein
LHLIFYGFKSGERRYIEKHRITRLNNVSKISNMSTQEMKTLLLSTRALYFACRLRPPTAVPIVLKSSEILPMSEWRSETGWRIEDGGVKIL